MVPEPKNISTNAAISVVMLPSKIALKAFLKPTLTESSSVLPLASSSLILAKIITFASTAIPIERMIPAIPGRVSVMASWNTERMHTISTV